MQQPINSPPQDALDATDNRSLVRVLAASGVGSALEWYDFFIYSTAAALVFNHLFFPKLSPFAGTLASLGSFGIGFLARPFGGLFFGHLGDRIGRKPVLVATFLIVGSATGLIGLLPTYAAIGVWAPCLLVALRLLQGFASGAEYGGAVIVAIEYAPPHRRGFFASWPTIGVIVGSLVASGVFGAVSTIWHDQLLAWAWRIPFLLSFVLVAFGIYVRLRVNETPVFLELANTRKSRRVPLFEAVAVNPRNFLLVVLATSGQNGVNYTFLVFGLNYVTTHLGIAKSAALMVLAATNIIQIVAVLGSSTLSDRVGRRPVYIAASLFTAAATFPFFLLLSTGKLSLICVAYFIASGVGYGCMFGPQAAFFAEMFEPRYRFTGFALARELGTIFGGGTAPLLSVALLRVGGERPWAVAGYVAALAITTALAVYLSPVNAPDPCYSAEMQAAPCSK